MTSATHCDAELLVLDGASGVPPSPVRSARRAGDRLVLDLHLAVYRQTEAMIHGVDVQEKPDVDLSDRANLLPPMMAARAVGLPTCV